MRKSYLVYNEDCNKFDKLFGISEEKRKNIISTSFNNSPLIMHIQPHITFCYGYSEMPDYCNNCDNHCHIIDFKKYYMKMRKDKLERILK